MGRTSRDEGSVHVLEAMVVATIMLSAIVFVVTYDQPASTGANAREGLAQRADDALAILYDTPVDSDFGSDALSAYIAQCLNGDCETLKAKLDAVTPTGSSYALYVSNGYDTYPVLVEATPVGEAVAASQAFEPRWSSTFLATATDLVGVGDALLTYELPIFNSNVVTPGGSHLVLKLEGSRRDGSDFVMLNSYSTVARDEDDDSSLAASLAFVDADGNAMAVHAPTMDVDEEIELLLRLEETQGGTIPEGVQVDVELPRGWTGYAPANETNSGWTIVANASDKNGAAVGSTITATLDEELSADHLDLRLNLTYHGDELDYYPFYARLSRGALAGASLLLRGEEHGGAPALATPIIGASVPSPMGNGEGDATTWTVFAYAPVETTGYGPAAMSGEIEVRKIEIREVEGNAIFAEDVTTLTTPAGGEWTSTGDTLTWYPDDTFSLTYDNPLNLTFTVKASGTAGPTDARAAFVPPVTFDDYTGKLVERSGWGFHRQAFLPATSEYGGFNGDATGGDDGWKAEHDAVADATYRTTELPGSTTYSATVLGSVEDALYGSYVSAEDREVGLGETIVMDVNVQSIIFQLAELNQEAGVRLRVYPPWSGDSRDNPVVNTALTDQGLLSGDVTQVELYDLNGDGIPDPIVGTTNGRVFAYSGLTGQRLTSGFTAPNSAVSEEANTLPSINTLDIAIIDGQPYIVVGTDKNSDGVFVLNSTLGVEWYWPFTGADVLAVDVSTSFAGDADPEIVVARSFEVGGSKNALTYVFQANARTAEQIAAGTPALLEPVLPETEVSEDANAFSYSLGTPTSVSSTDDAGPDGSGPGIFVPTQTLLDPGITLNQNSFPPTAERASLSTPRAGLLGIDADGVATSTLFGAPASIVLPYEYGPLDADDADGVDDVALGGASGYVIMSNGTVLTQPLYSYIMTGVNTLVDASSRSSAESYVLADNGIILLTDDAWITNWGPNTLVPTANAIAANDTNSFWVAGDANQMWQSVDSLETPLDSESHLPPFKELSAPLTPTIADDPLWFVGRVHSFKDLWFEGDEGWAVGDQCVACIDMPIVLHTTDGGVTWDALEADDFDTAPDADLHAVEVIDGTVWIVGDDGNVLRLLDGGSWERFDVGAFDLRDIACAPDDPDDCYLVGLDGAAFHVSDATGTPVFDDVSGEDGLPADKPLYSVGYQSADRIYVGSQNAVYARFMGADWTTLPMNYLENDARAVNGLGDGSGFVYGGSAGQGRIWLLHDYHIRSQAQTIDLGAQLPPGATIERVSVDETDLSLGGQSIEISAATLGDNWESLGTVAVSSDGDPRQALPLSAEFDGASGDELRFRITLETAGDKTIVSPHIRMLKFLVEHDQGDTYVTLDFDDATDMDEDETTAAWDTDVGALHQPLVSEYWTRNVGGEVLAMEDGFDLGGDTREDLWVGTGDILAENSPDYIIYAQSPDDPTEVVEPDNRVYLLDGRNGDVIASTEDPLEGEVRALRAADRDGDTVPESLYAITWDGVDGHLYELDPWSLQVRASWPVDLDGESPNDLELGLATPTRTAVFVGTERAAGDPDALGHLWAVDTQTRKPMWRSIPDELGRYEVEATIEPNWLFGPYVIEVEVTWEEALTESELPTEVVRSARFYDYFMVTPPDAVSPPTPVYTARLLLWMQDWS